MQLPPQQDRPDLQSPESQQPSPGAPHPPPPAGQGPQSMVPPQPSEIVPHCVSQVSGVQHSPSGMQTSPPQSHWRMPPQPSSSTPHCPLKSAQVLAVQQLPSG